ncbi:uncharacterized protein [Watersipora subatra]
MLKLAALLDEFLFGRLIHHTSKLNSGMPQPVVLSGPSGAGKSTLLNRLMSEFEGAFGFSVSHTTRSPRAGEQDGVAYNFVTRKDMEAAIANNEFIEHAEYSRNLYGTSILAVERVAETGKICILDVDSEGVKSIKKTQLNPRYIFIQPPSIDCLEERLKGRGTETEDSLRRRLDIAKREIAYSEAEGAYDHIIVNDDVDKAYTELRNILYEDAEQVLAKMQP